MTVLSASLLGDIGLIFLTQNRKSVPVTLFLYLHHYYHLHLESSLSSIKNIPEFTSFSQILLAFDSQHFVITIIS